MEKVFNHTAHRTLWQWLADNASIALVDKRNWPGWDRYEDKTGNTCFACDYAGGCSYCRNCPLVWPNQKECTEGNLWDVWFDAMEEGKYETAATLAEQIRDLPVREGVECI